MRSPVWSPTSSSRRWKSPVIVENNARGLNAGAEQVTRATPDGYTLLVSPPLPLTVANLLYRDINYQPAQFVPISLLAKGTNVLSMRRDFPANNVKELVAFAKANPNKVTYASQGPGSTAHLSGAQLEVRAGIKMTHVPYRGAAPAINDLIAGHIDIFFDTVTTAVPLFRGDKIKIIAVASPERIESLQELPTVAESGLPWLPLHHLVCDGRPAEDARRPGGPYQSRCGRDPASVRRGQAAARLQS